jgi:CelD/BcsL family acetyltransferase involved in cellulose biosynthesis
LLTVPVHTLDPLRDPRWPELLERHPSASVFHSRPWLEALRRTHGYEPIAYTTSPPGVELADALVFCRVNSWLTGGRLVSLPFSDHSEPLFDSEETLHYVLDALAREFRKASWKHIEIRPLRIAVDRAAGFEASDTFYFHRMDLNPPLETLFRTFHKDCTQRKIRRAEREALTHEAGRSELLLQKFYQLLLLTCRRKRLPPQPIVWFRHLIDRFGDGLAIHVASKDGRPVAGILTLSFKHTLVFKYGCSDASFNKLGGTHFLLWKAIQEAKNTGLQEFDLGRSDLHTPGLVAFKDRWGTQRSLINYFRCSRYPTSSVSRAWPTRLAKPFFARLPDRFLIAAGELLYRHMG